MKNLIQKLFPSAYQQIAKEAYDIGLKVGRNAGFADGYKEGKSEPKEAKIMFPITFNDEYVHMMGFYKMNDDENDSMRMIVNTPQYADFRKYLRLQALKFWVDGREIKDANVTTVINQIGKAIEALSHEIDSQYLKKEEEEETSNNYDV